MTNPNNAVGTNGAFGGRTSVNAFNDGISGYSAGILSGWACEPSSGLTVALGGDGDTRDVAIAEDNAGNKTTINNISAGPIPVTVGAAPSANSRIDSIVAYVDNPPTGTSTATDNYGACGLIVVAGTASSTPSAPTESNIRTAITADGASGTTAYYVVLANITISSGTTDLTSSNIKAGDISQTQPEHISLAKFPVIDTNTVLKTIGDLSSTYIYTSEYTGYIVGSLACPPSQGGTVALEVSIDGTNYVAVDGFGWIVMRADTRVHKNFCFPVSAGMKIKFTCGSGLTFGSVMLYAAKWI